MSFPYQQVLITPAEVGALHNVIAIARQHLPEGDGDVEAAYRWLAYARSGLFREWSQLPAGDHLKEAYREEVWTWTDEDLARIPEDRLVSLEDVRSIGDQLRREEVTDD